MGTHISDRRVHNLIGRWITHFIFATAVMSVPLSCLAGNVTIHKADSLFFEVVEDGEVTHEKVILDLWAVKPAKGESVVRLTMLLLPFDNENKRTQAIYWLASTDDNTITNVQIDPTSVRFDFTGVASDDRYQFVGIRIGSETSSNYKAKISGLIKGLLHKDKIYQQEWRQIPSIKMKDVEIFR